MAMHRSWSNAVLTGNDFTAIPQPEETEVLKGLLQREGGEI